jgi:hypothetical protein
VADCHIVIENRRAGLLRSGFYACISRAALSRIAISACWAATRS